MSTGQRYSFTWELMGDVLLGNWTPGPIPDERFKEYLRVLNDNRVRVSFSLVQGSVSITADQRKQAAEALKKRDLETIVVTDSRLTRGMLTALSWLGAKIKPYSWGELDRALQHTAAPNRIQEQLRQAALKFRQETEGLDDAADGS